MSDGILHKTKVSDDEAVQATNDDATSCKRYAVQKGYWVDNYVGLFSKTLERKSPEINRGYYARVTVFRILVEKFIRQTNKACQVISLGAGFDTLFWHLHSRSLCPAVYLEIDFNSVVARKCHIISAKSVLRDLLEEPTFSEDGVQSSHYQLLAGDLRNMKTLGDRILSRGVDTSLPTMILAECVLIYMEPEKSQEIVHWFGKQFPTALFLNYEPIRPWDRFGQAMRTNLTHRRCSLLGIDACPDLDSQRKRFLNHGWSESWALDMADVYRALPKDECTRIERIELLDEQELLLQLLLHYCLSCGYSDHSKQGLGSITLDTT